MRRLVIAFTTLLILPAGAQAGFFAAEPVDGPNGDIQSMGDVDVARDGSGAVAYVKRDGGVDHIFVSRLVNGVFQAPERVDAGLEAPASQPVVASSDGAKVVVVFISGGQAFSVVRPPGATAFTAPALVAAGASNPSVDMSINGVAYTTVTVGGDVRAGRLERNAQAFAILPDALDADSGRTAGEGVGRSRVVVSADGTALAVWAEDGRVIARRLFGQSVSTAPQELNVPSLDGRAGGTADSPDVDIEDDSSFAYVIFRQSFNDGGTQRSRVLARKLRGSAFEDPYVTDGLDWGGEGATFPRIDLNGRGEGVATNGTNGSNSVLAAVIKDEKFNPGVALGGGGVAPQPVGTIGETQDRVVAWLQGGGTLDPVTVRARLYDDKPDSRVVPFPEPEVTLSNGGLGPVDPGAGLDAAMNRAGDVVVVFVQGAGGDRRLVSATFDRAPGTFLGYTSTKWRNIKRNGLAWSPSFELWGPPTYRVEIDGRAVGETRETKMLITAPVADGEHRWRVVSTDRRGQTVATPTRLLRADSRAPKVTFKVTGKRKRGGFVKVLARANDVLPASGKASGVKFVRIDFGDRSGIVTARRASHRYGRSGSFTIRVSATDAAGNASATTRRIRVK
jgi:hypothetical protein